MVASKHEKWRPALPTRDRRDPTLDRWTPALRSVTVTDDLLASADKGPPLELRSAGDARDHAWARPACRARTESAMCECGVGSALALAAAGLIVMSLLQAPRLGRVIVLRLSLSCASRYG